MERWRPRERAPEPHLAHGRHRAPHTRGTLQSLDKNPDTERKFWNLAAEKVFRNAPDWQELVRRRLESPP